MAMVSSHIRTEMCIKATGNFSKMAQKLTNFRQQGKKHGQGTQTYQKDQRRYSGTERL